MKSKALLKVRKTGWNIHFRQCKTLKCKLLGREGGYAPKKSPHPPPGKTLQSQENRQFDYFFLFWRPAYFIENYVDSLSFFKKESEQLYEEFIDSKTRSEKEISWDGTLGSK